MIIAFGLCAPVQATTCRQDVNQNGVLSVQDIFDYLGSWFGGHADFNRDGTTTVQDMFDYLGAWFKGCDSCAQVLPLNSPASSIDALATVGSVTGVSLYNTDVLVVEPISPGSHNYVIRAYSTCTASISAPFGVLSIATPGWRSPDYEVRDSGSRFVSRVGGAYYRLTSMDGAVIVYISGLTFEVTRESGGDVQSYLSILPVAASQTYEGGGVPHNPFGGFGDAGVNWCDATTWPLNTPPCDRPSQLSCEQNCDCDAKQSHYVAMCKNQIAINACTRELNICLASVFGGALIAGFSSGPFGPFVYFGTLAVGGGACYYIFEYSCKYNADQNLVADMNALDAAYRSCMDRCYGISYP